MLKSFVYRLYPNNDQKHALTNAFGCVRFVYNQALAYKKDQYETHKKNISCFDLQNGLLINLKKEYDWLRKPHSQSLQSSILNLDIAYKNFFRRCKKGEKPGFPKFKNKFGKQSVSFPQNVKVDFKNNRIKIPKIGEVFAVLHRKFEGKIKTCTVSKTKTDKYFISVLVEDNKELPKKLPGKTIALDLGIKDFIAFSNGKKIKGEKYFKFYAKKLAREQRKLSLKKKGSNNRQKQKLKVAKVYEKIFNKRNDYLHKLSKKIINENQVIIIEKLNVKNMLEISNKNLARNISDVSWSIFTVMLKYKADFYGKSVFEVNPKNTSKMCNNCKEINKELTLSERQWKCEKCSLQHDRDINAAKNILEVGQELAEYKALNNSNLLVI